MNSSPSEAFLLYPGTGQKQLNAKKELKPELFSSLLIALKIKYNFQYLINTIISCNRFPGNIFQRRDAGVHQNSARPFWDRMYIS